MKVGIVGLGYVGLPLAVAFAEAGSEVVGVDVNTHRVERLRRSESDIEDIGSERLRAIAPQFTASDEYRALAGCEAIVICVPTPLTGAPGARPLLPRRGRERALQGAPRGASGGCRVDHLSRAPPASG